MCRGVVSVVAGLLMCRCEELVVLLVCCADDGDSRWVMVVCRVGVEICVGGRAEGDRCSAGVEDRRAAELGVGWWPADWGVRAALGDVDERNWGRFTC